MRSKLVAVVFVLIAGSTSEVHAAGLLNKHNNQNIDATKGTGSAVDTFVKLCLRAIDRYNRENGSSNLMKNYPRSVKQLTDLTENVYKNSRSQAKALASTAMQTVQEVVDFGSNDRDASHTGTLNMLTEIYHRWNKTYPAIFWDDSALIKQPAFVSNRATGRNTLEQSNPINLILSGEKSKKEEHADLIQTPQEITPNHVMPTATDRGSIANSEMKGRKIRTNSKRKQIVEGRTIVCYQSPSL